jgi:hypothetical protein
LYGDKYTALGEIPHLTIYVALYLMQLFYIFISYGAIARTKKFIKLCDEVKISRAAYSSILDSVIFNKIIKRFKF